jgi:DNA polymerase/3'-5' exonuclease PolX
LRELVETGDIAELAELERELTPGLIGLGRYLGLSARRSVEIARALGVSTPDELREAAAAGRLQAVPGVGPKTEARLLEALAREADPRPQRGLLLPRALELVGGIAAALEGKAAGDVRRWRHSCEQLAVVCAAADPGVPLARFAELPQIVALVEQAARRALGVTVEGVPVELVVAEPERFGAALVRATGSRDYVAALEPLPDAAAEPAVYDALGLPWCPPELREQPFRGTPPALVAPATAATSTSRSATTRRPSAPSPGSRRTTSAGRPRRSRPPTRCCPRSASCAGSSATSSPTAGSTSPTTCWPSSTGCRRACTADSGCRGASRRGASRRRCATRTCAA